MNDNKTTGGEARRPEHESAAASTGAPPSQVRKYPVHGVFNLPNQPTIVSVTVCTKNRKRWLANELVHKLLVDVWVKADRWLVGRYVIMPDPSICSLLKMATFHSTTG